MDITLLNDNKEIKKLLIPMEYILDKKNIVEGIKSIIEDEKIYICFNKDYLSDTNKTILEKISYIYSEMLFYSDNDSMPNVDRLEYWCPDEDYDNSYHITKRIRDKKMFVLELDASKEFEVLGITIMLANTLQEQDPTILSAYENVSVLSSDLIKRHEHYLESGSPDLDWLQLTVSLNKDNPLQENFYAPFIGVCEINTSVSCDNMLLAVMVGTCEKRCIDFNIEWKNLEKSIKNFLFSDFTSEVYDEKVLVEEVKKRLIQY